LAGQYGVHPTPIHAWKNHLAAGPETDIANGSSPERTFVPCRFRCERYVEDQHVNPFSPCFSGIPAKRERIILPCVSLPECASGLRGTRDEGLIRLDFPSPCPLPLGEGSGVRENRYVWCPYCTGKRMTRLHENFGFGLYHCRLCDATGLVSKENTDFRLLKQWLTH
jgi:hypothetical protein